MTDRLFPEIETDAEHEADLREREDDPTPRGVVRAVLAAAFAHGAFPETVLDVCAGYGCWSSEIRRAAARWGCKPPRITAVEIDPRKREHLAKWADVVIIGDWREALGGDYDVAIGNPHFTALVGDRMPERLLDVAGHVLLLHTQQAFLRGLAGRDLWRFCTPAHQYLVPGAVSFRSDGKTDSRCYVVSKWTRSVLGRRPRAQMLDEIPSAGRRWRVPPGTEQPSDDLPAAPGWVGGAA